MTTWAENDRSLLASVSILGRLSPSDRTAVLASTSQCHFPPGRPIVIQQDRVESFFVVLDGEIEVHTQARDGRDIVLATMGPGCYFGEQGLTAPGRGRRSASVRALTAVRCAEIPRSAFEEYVHPLEANRIELDRTAVANLHRRLVSSLEILGDVEVGTIAGDDPERTDELGEVRVPLGHEVIRQGTVADSVYFVLEGIALVLQHEGGTVVELSRVGPGQCFGELGAIHDQRREASVVAETDLKLLRVDAAWFLEWHATSPRLRDFLRTLETVYPLAEGRLLSVYRGSYEGEASISTILGDPSGKAVVSTKVLGRDVVVLARTGDRGTDMVDFESEGTSRELHLADVERGDKGRVTTGRLVGVVARGIREDVGLLYRDVLAGRRLTSRELQRFRRTGHLGGPLTARPGGAVCHCLQVTAADVMAAAAARRPSDDEVGDVRGPAASPYVLVQRALGVGMVCGACRPAVGEIVAGRGAPGSRLTEVAATSTEGTSPTSIVVRTPDFVFGGEQLAAIRDVVEVQVIAVASVFSSPAERFMINSIGAARALLADEVLQADVDAFLAQEANHVHAHEQLNVLFLEEIYPEVRSLATVHEKAFDGYERLPLKTRLAVCAAAESIADALFSAFFRRYYDRAAVLHPDPRVNDHLLGSGVGELFAWHGLEELEHRHVAFAVMQAARTPYRTRLVGFGLAMLGVFRFQLPAFFGVRRAAGPSWRDYLRVAFVDPGLLRGYRSGLLDYLRPSFDPSKVDYEFLPRLRRDTAHLPTE